MAVDKFRPLLSVSDIQLILSRLEQGEHCPQAVAVSSKLAICIMKANAGLTKPSARVAEESTGKNSLENDLGISEEDKAVDMEASYRRSMKEAPLTEEEKEAIKLAVRAEVSASAKVPASAASPVPVPVNATTNPVLRGFELPVDMGNPFAGRKEVA